MEGGKEGEREWEGGRERDGRRERGIYFIEDSCINDIIMIL